MLLIPLNSKLPKWAFDAINHSRLLNNVNENNKQQLPFCSCFEKTVMLYSGITIMKTINQVQLIAVFGWFGGFRLVADGFGWFTVLAVTVFSPNKYHSYKHKKSWKPCVTIFCWGNYDICKVSLHMLCFSSNCLVAA